jgi:hypothetical protein
MMTVPGTPASRARDEISFSEQMQAELHTVGDPGTTVRSSRARLVVGVAVAAVLVLAVLVFLRLRSGGGEPRAAREGAIAAPPRAPARVVVELSIDPAGALVQLDGKPLEAGLETLELPRDESKSHEIAISKEGYVTQRHRFPADKDQHLLISLKPDEPLASDEIESVETKEPVGKRHPKRRAIMQEKTRKKEKKKPGLGLVDSPYS